MSLSSRIIVRLTITTAVAAAISYGWLYLKQSHVEAYLRERTLVRQAQEVSSFISTSPDGSIYLDLPSKLSEAYNNPGSRYRYAVRDEAGRIVATSGRRVGPLPDMIRVQDHHIYSYRADAENAAMLGAAVRTDIGQKVLFTQVEQTVPMTQSLHAAVFNEFFMDGGWLGIPFLLAVLGNKRIDGQAIACPTERAGNSGDQNRSRTLDIAAAIHGNSQRDSPARQLGEQRARPA